MNNSSALSGLVGAALTYGDMREQGLRLQKLGVVAMPGGAGPGSSHQVRWASKLVPLGEAVLANPRSAAFPVISNRVTFHLKRAYEELDRYCNLIGSRPEVSESPINALARVRGLRSNADFSSLLDQIDVALLARVVRDLEARVKEAPGLPSPTLRAPGSLTLPGHKGGSAVDREALVLR